MSGRSRSRSPQRDDDNAHDAHDDSRGDDAPHDNGESGGGAGGDGAGGGGDGGDGEEVKLYVGNLNYGESFPSLNY